MPTEVLRVLDRAALKEELDRAASILRAGGLVAFPTETVYGIAVSAENPEAIKRLYALKGRPRDKPMSMMVASIEAVRQRCHDLSPTATQLIKRFWPGPLTIVLPSKNGDGAKGGLVGFRYPSHPLAQGLVEATGVPLFVPSANLSGQPPATTAQEVLSYFPDQPRPRDRRRPLRWRRGEHGRGRGRQPDRRAARGRRTGVARASAADRQRPLRLHGQHRSQPARGGHPAPASGRAARAARSRSWRSAGSASRARARRPKRASGPRGASAPSPPRSSTPRSCSTTTSRAS